jgi:hypothetical protein
MSKNKGLLPFGAATMAAESNTHPHHRMVNSFFDTIVVLPPTHFYLSDVDL